MLHQRLNTAGFTLIEVVITLFIMTVGLLGLAGLQAQAIKASLDTAQRSQTAWLVSEVAERIRANPDASVSDYTATLTTTACLKPDKQCNTDCTPAQMAAYDLWDIFCGIDTQGVVAKAVDSLTLSELSIHCKKNCTNSAAHLAVSIHWGKDPNQQQITMEVRP
ncbi:type IV pilus modification protein PilV [Oceanicoccus sagamiensis]|uniref:Type IV pilus modification protein PilV n=1 Tax=Oceanicoccus sagamiensis TaxID=716816 RepID=A0A1X9N3T8_9GAMM|nr:type IV pilus modification protein PilV [Oceanicoccus sagamiensis]ARN72840.1 type IV pilus modification protein PilV [Oceanicoccus sagamiensis]